MIHVFFAFFSFAAWSVNSGALEKGVDSVDRRVPGVLFFFVLLGYIQIVMVLEFFFLVS